MVLYEHLELITRKPVVIGCFSMHAITFSYQQQSWSFHDQNCALLSYSRVYKQKPRWSNSKATHALPICGKGKVYWSSYTYGPRSEALLEEGGTFSGQRLGETPVKASLKVAHRFLCLYSPSKYGCYHKRCLLMDTLHPKRFLSSTFDCQLYDKYETNKDTKSNLPAAKRLGLRLV